MEHQAIREKNVGTVPDKLLRIFISEQCNFNCTFCCWDDPSAKRPTPPLMRTDELRVIAEAMIQAGCRNFQLTGGEPLIHRREYFCDVVNTISSTPGLDQFWIVTNGSLLQDEQLCAKLYSAGLRRINISIAAETDEKYRRYSRSRFSLDGALEAIRIASSQGISMHVHTCLNADGVTSFEQFSTLLRAAQERGARHAFYFEVFSTPDIAQDFRRLHVDAQKVTEGFLASGEWKLRHTEKGRPYFWNDFMRVYIPRKRAFLVTDTCKFNDCGDFCQGIYAAQLVNDEQGIAVRACQRIFADDRNLFRIEGDWLRRRDICKLAELFGRAWSYAYGR